MKPYLILCLILTGCAHGLWHDLQTGKAANDLTFAAAHLWRSSPTPTPTATATPTPGATPIGKPHGIFDLLPLNPPAATAGDAWVTSSAIDGVVVAYKWLGKTQLNQSSGSPLSVLVNTSTDTFTANAIHGLGVGDRIAFSSSNTLPGGLSANTSYFVISSGLTTTAFKVSATSGGSAVDITTSGTGVTFLYMWGLEGAADNAYNYANLDGYLDLAVAHSKQIEVVIDASGNTAAEGALSWLQSTHIVVSGGQGQWLYIPSATPFHSKYEEFITAFLTRYNGTTRPRITMVVIGCPGANTQLTSDATVIAGFESNGGLSAWEGAAKDFIATAFAASPFTVFELSIKNPYGTNNAAGSAALSDLTTFLNATYPADWIGWENVDLYTGTNSGSGLPNIIIHRDSGTHPVGYQLRSSTAGFAHIDLGCAMGQSSVDCLTTVCQKGIDIGAHFLKVYDADASNPDFAATLTTLGNEMDHFGP